MNNWKGYGPAYSEVGRLAQRRGCNGHRVVLGLSSHFVVLADREQGK